MSSLEKVDDFFFIIKKYLLPALFLVIGILLFIEAAVPKVVELNNGETIQVQQSKLFLYAAIIFIVVSVVWFLYLFDLIKSIVGYGIMAIMLVGSVVILYLDYKTVQEEVVFKKRYERIEREIMTRMQDVKAAEIAYKQSKGTYTNDIGDLIEFVKTGKTMDIVKIGAIPPRTITAEERDLIYGDNRAIDNLMNEFEAAYLARSENPPADLKGFQRDTVYLPVMDAIFYSDRYLDNREKIGGELAFHPDSLMYVPFTQDQVVLDTSSVPKGEINVPTLRISMTHPMEDPIEGRVEYIIGALKDNHLRDNWSN
ncbi:MAG: hypothetical protein WDZ35_06100 [Crocinitomicaceae bacterium]